MRIAFVAPFGLRSKGTARARALPLARAVAACGHQAALFVPPYDSPEDSGLCWRDGDVPVFNVPLPSFPPALEPAGQEQVPPGLAGAWWYLRLSQRLLSAVNAWRPEVVHLFKPKGPSGLAGTALWTARALRPAVRVIVDSDDWEGAGGWNDDPRAGYSALQRRAFAWQEGYGLSHAHAWTLASACLRERALKFGADPRRVFVLPNGISDAALWLAPLSPHLPPAEGHRLPSVLLYTRFAGVRVGDVVEIWRRVRALVPDATLSVVGRGLGGEEQELASVAPGVQVIGWVEPREMPVLFAAHDVAIVPWADTPPNCARNSAKVLELMAAGLPIVGYGVGEIPATVAGAGIIIRPGDAAALAQAVADLLSDRQQAVRLGAMARERVREYYTWDRLARIALVAYGAGR